MIHHISVLVVMDEDQGLDEGKQTKTKESFELVEKGLGMVSIKPYLSVVFFLVKFINMKP